VELCFEIPQKARSILLALTYVSFRRDTINALAPSEMLYLTQLRFLQADISNPHHWLISLLTLNRPSHPKAIQPTRLCPSRRDTIIRPPRNYSDLQQCCSASYIEYTGQSPRSPSLTSWYTTVSSASTSFTRKRTLANYSYCCRAKLLRRISQREALPALLPGQYLREHNPWRTGGEGRWG